MKLRLFTLIIFLVLTTGLYYWASDPHSLRIFWVTIPALLIGLAVELMKKRKATT